MPAKKMKSYSEIEAQLEVAVQDLRAEMEGRKFITLIREYQGKVNALRWVLYGEDWE